MNKNVNILCPNKRIKHRLHNELGQRKSEKKKFLLISKKVYNPLRPFKCDIVPGINIWLVVSMGSNMTPGGDNKRNRGLHPACH